MENRTTPASTSGGRGGLGYVSTVVDVTQFDVCGLVDECFGCILDREVLGRVTWRNSGSRYPLALASHAGRTFQPFASN